MSRMMRGERTPEAWVEHDQAEGLGVEPPCRSVAPWFTIETHGGACPYQATGRIGPHVWYFRARSGEWTMDIGEPEADSLAAGRIYVDDWSAVWRAWGEDEHGGWPDHADALPVIEACVAAYRGGEPTDWEGPNIKAGPGRSDG